MSSFYDLTDKAILLASIIFGILIYTSMHITLTLVRKNNIKIQIVFPMIAGVIVAFLAYIFWAVIYGYST